MHYHEDKLKKSNSQSHEKQGMGHTAAPLTHSSPPCFFELIVLLFLFLRGFVLLLRLCAVPGDDAGRCCRLLVAVIVLPLHSADMPASVHEAPDHHDMSCLSLNRPHSRSALRCISSY